MKSKIYICCFFLCIGTSLIGQEQKQNEKELIRETLNAFQKGFVERDTSKAVQWCNELFYENIEILGTYSIHSNGLEWFTGMDRAIKVFKSDWLYWGDLESKIEEANIDYDGNFAWVTFEAVITRSPENSRSRRAEASAGGIFRHFKNLSEEDEGRTNKLKLMEAAYYANLILFQYEQGEEFVWPIRVSAALQKKEGKWKFRQIHMSHPNQGFPNVRNTSK